LKVNLNLGAGDEGATTLTADDQALGLQLVHGPHHCKTAHAKARHEVVFSGQAVTRPQSLLFNQVSNCIFDFSV
jgi:hypothetical protein